MPDIVAGKRVRRVIRGTPYEVVMAQTQREGDCLVFTGSRNKGGYGIVRGKYVHRIVLEHHYGPSPLGTLHSCDNPPCVEIKHLKYGTQKENMQDRDAKGRGRRPWGRKRK